MPNHDGLQSQGQCPRRGGFSSELRLLRKLAEVVEEALGQVSVMIQALKMGGELLLEPSLDEELEPV